MRDLPLMPGPKIEPAVIGTIALTPKGVAPIMVGAESVRFALNSKLTFGGLG